MAKRKTKKRNDLKSKKFFVLGVSLVVVTAIVLTLINNFQGGVIYSDYEIIYPNANGKINSWSTGPDCNVNYDCVNEEFIESNKNSYVYINKGRKERDYYHLEVPTEGSFINEKMKAINNIKVNIFAEKMGGKEAKISVYLLVDGKDYLLNTWNLINEPQYLYHYASSKPITADLSHGDSWRREDARGGNWIQEDFKDLQIGIECERSEDSGPEDGCKVYQARVLVQWD